MSTLFPSVNRDELENIFTERQIEIVDHNIVVFMDDLHVGILWDFVEDGWSKLNGVIFTYVEDSYRRIFNYPTSIGHFENVADKHSLIQRYIFTVLDKRKLK